MVHYRSPTPARLLLADDDLAIRVLTQAVLKRMGHDVWLATNGLDALAALHENDIDVLLTDLLMPGLSGFDLIQKVRSDERFAYLSIIVLATEGRRHVDLIPPEQITYAILKPFDLDTFITVLEDAIAKARAARIQGENAGSRRMGGRTPVDKR